MINYNNTSRLLTSQVKDTATLNIKPKAFKGTSDTEFNSILDRNLSNTTRRINASNTQKEDNNISLNNDSKVKYKSFRDVKMSQRVSSQEKLKKTSTGNDELQNVDLQSEILESSYEEYNEQISVLAQMLGLQPNELVELANELGFSAEDLEGLETLSLFTDKLANLLELDDSQKTMISKLVAEVSKQVKTVDDSEVVVTLESQNDIEALDEAGANINTKSIDLSKITDEVKAKLNQLIQNVKVNSEAVSSEISKVIEAMKSQIKAKVSANTEQVEAKNITTPSTITDTQNSDQISAEGNVTKKKESEKTSDSKEETNSKNADSSSTKSEVDIKSVNTQVSTSNDQNHQQNQQNVQTIGDVKISMINNQVEAQKSVSSMPQPIKSSEILNQVVEQAKVIIAQDKSEMVIQLKPDHLGKLELKVVTEQGIVAAKFIAESQQVKEIIETNMQLLKDSLQKQGISIDSVSVQVGHDKQSEYQQHSSYQSKNSSSNRSNYGGDELGMGQIGFNAFDALPERLAQYSYESNTINLTA